MTYQAKNGSITTAIPEPFWYRGLMTWFRLRPTCLYCVKAFKNRDAWEDHYIKCHSVEWWKQ